MPATMPSMCALSAVHEYVHQWAGQQQQEWQCAKAVGTVFAQQKTRGEGSEHEQAECVSEAPERRCAVLVEPLSRL